MAKKYKIDKVHGWSNYQEGNKYCQFCGEKNVIQPQPYFDGKTGIQEAWMVCKNPNCTFGETYICDTSGGCNYQKEGWFGSKKCTRCGRGEPFYEFI